MDYTQFDKMADSLNSDFKAEAKVIGDTDSEYIDQGRTREEIKQELVVAKQDNLPEVITEPDPIIMEDQSYIQDELKVGIEMMSDVAETLRSELKQGTPPRAFEVFATVMKERREHIKEYKDTNMAIRDTMNKDEPGSPGTINNNLILTSAEVLDLILQANNGLDDNGLDKSKEV